jgi:hypothetical protein
MSPSRSESRKLERVWITINAVTQRRNLPDYFPTPAKPE